jgi:hypothetical protein
MHNVTLRAGRTNFMEDIIDHKTDGHAIDRADTWIKNWSSNQVRKATKGWHLVVEWKDGIKRWKGLVDLKESHPVEVAEYADDKNLIDAPDFVWWAPHVLKDLSRIISAVTKRYHKHTHNFGIEVPNRWDDCVRLDKENGNTLWQDEVREYMKNVRIAFKILNGEE